MASGRVRRPRLDAYTAYHHFRAAAGGGLVAGIFVLNEYVARKELGATRWHVLALLLVPALAQGIAVFRNPADPRRLLGRRPFRHLGMPSRLALLLLLVPALHGPTWFVAVLALPLAVEALLIPIQNTILASNYARATRGQRFGMAAAIQAAAIMVVSLPAGLLLDHEEEFQQAVARGGEALGLGGLRLEPWPLLYAAAAAAGIWGFHHWSRLRRRRPPQALVGVLEHGSPWATLRRDKAFLAFEGCFMVYGLGFLMLQPVLPIYLVDELHVTYSQVGLARGFLFWMAIVIGGPLLGRVVDRLGVLHVGAMSFLALCAFPLLLLLVPGTAGLYLGFTAYGLAMAGVNVSWNLGPIVIAGERDPLPYLNAHVALVGLRALIGLVAGTLLQYVAGTRPVFWTVLALEIAAAAGMATLALRSRR